VKNRRSRRKRTEHQERKILYSEAIEFLLMKSLDLRTKDPDLARDYYVSAQKMGRRGRIHLPKSFKHFYCHSCQVPIRSDTIKVRFNSKKNQIHYKCLKCGNIQKFGYTKEKTRG
jgi:RNase P subunit RPR2